MGKERSEEEIKALLEKIKAEDSLIIVEGKKDRAALEGLGIEGDFFLLSSQRTSFYESAEKIASKYDKVLLFLDLDKEGRKLSNTIKKYLGELGVKVDSSLGKRLLRLGDTQFVEGLYRPGLTHLF